MKQYQPTILTCIFFNPNFLAKLKKKKKREAKKKWVKISNNNG